MTDVSRASRAALPNAQPFIDHLLKIAVRGLSQIGGQTVTDVPQTYRGLPSADGPRLEPQGRNLRYAAIAALGLGRMADDVQRAALDGRTAADFALECQAAALRQTEPGAAALSLWAAAEVAGAADSSLVAPLATALDGAVDTVVASWILMAAVEVGAEADLLRDRAALRLLAYRGTAGVFAHTLPPARGVRGHVGCFADQVYPIQAFARLHTVTGRPEHLAVANETARRIVDLQGDHGQWWWHYDRRDGSVVEGFPVYAVHQHGMAPMALLELAETGGDDHADAVQRGVGWLTTHPECMEPLIAPELGVVWRKVGRREAVKASRAIGALTTSIRPGLHVPGLDRVMPPGHIDYECRPYELGWLLYAWGSPQRSAA
ncbi:hypothetical protein [Microbacterium sp. Leaf288]|uniref:hypothetical protein n=1 Tax=Microbacterium sp. Leaf288 TaxID=1736323 RepID=UPI000A9A3C18|nr:hypothetical protein [Microbacterium sp. Leaf288]